MTDCPICKSTEGVREFPSGGVDGCRIDCPRCGSYWITGSAKACIHEPNMKLAAWVRNQNERDQTPTISSDTLEEVKKLSGYSVLDKQIILLRAVAKRSEYPGFMVEFDLKRDYPLAWAAGVEEFHYILNSLKERGMVSLPAPVLGAERVVITPHGWEVLASLESTSAFDDQAFVAMWFDAEMDDAWEQGIKPAVEQAGYRPIRVDKELHIDRIDAKIVADIKDSRFLVADVTGQRAGVYFEAGYAMGLGRPVIWCVREDQLNEVHFDTRQYNHIVWGTPDELKEELYQLIRAVIGARASAQADKE